MFKCEKYRNSKNKPSSQLLSFIEQLPTVTNVRVYDHKEAMASNDPRVRRAAIRYKNTAGSHLDD